MNSPKEPIRTELLRIEEDCTYSGKAHFNAAGRWGSYHFWLGLPAVGLSALAGLAFFKDYTVVAAAMSGTAAVLTAFQTFMKPSERSASHKAAGDQYLGLRNDARVFREIRMEHVCDDQAAIDGLDEFTKRRKELNMASPQIARRDFTRARKGIEGGEAKHAVDQKG
jgi:hypothetical protein